MSLVIFGYGYSAQHFVQKFGESYRPILATVRVRQRARSLSSPDCSTVAFGDDVDEQIFPALQKATHLLISTPPHSSGDPVLEKIAEQIAAAPALEAIVYLSTVGVYGDHHGDWIDEGTLCKPSNDRSRWRLAAEQEWLALGRDMNVPVHVLRLAGIYGPGQNALANLKAGTARRIIKPGQVFNRIHVEDIAATIDACFQSKTRGGIWNVSDDEPAPPQDVIAFAADLMGIAPPPELDFNTADLSPMARSFYAECKRVSNRAIKERLGVRLAYPTYREALRALYSAGEGR